MSDSRGKLWNALRCKEKKRRVVIFDPDPGNPYGRELGALLASDFKVKVLVPVDTEWIPTGIEIRCILPANGPANLAKQIVLQALGLAVTARDAFLWRSVIIVVGTRSWYDQLALALLATMGARTVVVAHDPVPKQALSRVRLFSRRFLWRRARAVITHSEQLAAEASRACGRHVHSVPHLPFTEYAAWARAISPDPKSGAQCRLLVLGHMREDKGLDRLPVILGLLPNAGRSQFSISFAGRGDCGKAVAEVARLLTVTRAPVDHWLTDVEIAQELAKGDVLLAPYTRVSASGSVVLALSTGLRVVAYDTGALADVVAPTGLVGLGDERVFAERIAAAAHTHCGGPARTIPEWKDASFKAWSKVILNEVADLPFEAQIKA
jgi:glycosyltransferase involved in cell wall biosynthesis